MASQTQDFVQVVNTTNNAVESTLQELTASTEITTLQLKDDNSQDSTKLSKIDGNIMENAITGEDKPISINFTQADTGEFTAEKKSKKKGRQTAIKESITSIQASESVITKTSTTSRISKKRKTEEIYASAVTKEKTEVSENAITIGERQKRNNKNKTHATETSSSNNQKRHKLTTDIITPSSNLSIPSFQSDEQDKFAEDPFSEDATNKQRRQAADKPKAAPIERPRRSVKPVVPYGSEVVEQKVRNKKPVEILQGSGIPLSQIPHVLRAIDKMKTSDDVLKGLHKLIYGRMGSKHDIKSHIRAFSGFKIQTPLDEIVLKEKLEKWKIAGLKDMCHLFGLKSSGDKQKVVDRVYDFLKNPRDMTAPNEGNGKSKSGKKKKSVAAKVKTTKTARDIFNAEQRPIYKEKAENHSKTRAEIDSLIAEAWKGLTEDDKKLYAEKATEANRTKPKRQNSNKIRIKQPEIIEDSDISDEEFEDVIMRENEVEEQIEQSKDNSSSDFSDPPNDDENNKDDDVMKVDLEMNVPEPVHSSHK